MVEYEITWISASASGRAARGPDWYGRADTFYYLFDPWNTFTMSYSVYMSVAEEYRDEIPLSRVTITGVPPDPCEGMVCEPDCFGTRNKYETVCYEGECKLGPLIEENSPDCPGYVPPPEPFACNDGELRGGTVCLDGSIIYTEVCQSNKWVATGAVCPEEHEPGPDDDQKWIAYALIGAAVVLFYLLATMRSS